MVDRADRPPRDPVAAGRLDRVGARPGQGGRPHRPGRRRRPTSRAGTVDRYSQHRVCDGCGRSFDELAPHHFSFNSPLGWCPVCQGLGVQHGANPAVLDPRRPVSLRQGAVAVWPDFDDEPRLRPDDRGDRPRSQGIDLTTPFDELEGRAPPRSSSTARARPGFTSPAGSGQPAFSFQYKGLFPAIEEAGRVSFVYRYKLQGMVDDVPCAGCMGARLRDDAAAVRFQGLHARPDQPTGRWARPWRSSRT